MTLAVQSVLGTKPFALAGACDAAPIIRHDLKHINKENYASPLEVINVDYFSLSRDGREPLLSTTFKESYLMLGKRFENNSLLDREL